MGVRTSRTSPDMSILSVGLTTGQDKTPPYKGVCLSVVLSNDSEDQNLKNIPAGRPPMDRRRYFADLARRPRLGPIQVRIRRELIIAGKPLTTPELAKRVYPRTTPWTKYIRVAALKVAVPLYRQRSVGNPWVWQLK